MELSKLTKLYYSIGEVSALFGVSTSLLRYWETQFPTIKPQKGRTGKRRYTKKDIEGISKVYQLVKIEGFTLEGAQKNLASQREQNTNEPVIDQIIENLEGIVSRLKHLESKNGRS